MGCSGSKPAGVAEEEGVPTKIRPLLRRRLEEMKKRNHAGVLKGTQTLSKKGLLRHRSDGDETENDISMRSSRVAPAPESVLEVKKEVIYEEKLNESMQEEKKEEKEDKAFQVIMKENKKTEEKEDNDDYYHDHDHHDDDKGGDDDKEEEGRMSNLDESMICPGSPSFRIYCVGYSEEEGKSKEAKKKLNMENNIIIVDTNEELMNKLENRRRKRRKFRIPLRRVTHTPGKYLFNITSFYSQGICMGNPHSRLTQEKSLER